jgi:hypothetical protein
MSQLHPWRKRTKKTIDSNSIVPDCINFCRTHLGKPKCLALPKLAAGFSQWPSGCGLALSTSHSPLLLIFRRNLRLSTTRKMASSTFESQGVRIAVEGCVSLFTSHPSRPLQWHQLTFFSGPWRARLNICFRQAVRSRARLGWRWPAYHWRRFPGTFVTQFFSQQIRAAN